MDFLVRSAQIIDPNSPHHRKKRDILIRDGVIYKIAASIKKSKPANEIKAKNLHVSPGWLDLNTNMCDPGYEHKEDLESGTKAAAFGGFTGLCCLPNTNPPLHSKSEIEYIQSQTADNIVDVFPIAAISKDCKGKDIAELYDMRRSGAVAFTDGPLNPISAGLMERSLLYVKPFAGVIFCHPEEPSVSLNRSMHEGIVSTMLGLKGAPALAEELAVARDIYLAEYTASKVHFINISTKRAVELIKGAKKKKASITASVNIYNLFLDDSYLTEYDTHFKVNPHLRGKDDVRALIKGIEDGTIDCIASGHNPQDEESKKVEFDMAAFGMIGLETAFAAANTALQSKVGLERLIQCIAIQPRKVIGMPMVQIVEGVNANLTLFDPFVKWKFAAKHIKSKSKNTPFIDWQFTGKALGIINNKKVYLAN